MEYVIALVVIAVVIALLGWRVYVNLKAGSAPTWSGFRRQEEYDRFVRQVKAYFERRQISVEVHDGVITSDQEGYSSLGLQNLAQVCNQLPVADWDEAIEDHFACMEKARQEGEALESDMQDFDKIKDLLAVRLFPEEHALHIGVENLVCRRDLKGTVSVLVYDLEFSTQTVKPDTAKEWGLSNQELFELGLEKIRSSYPVEHETQEIAEDIKVHTFVGDHFYGSSHVLLLDDYPEVKGKYGILIGVPHRHTMICYPIDDLRAITAVNMLVPAIRGMEQEGPGSLSPELYWWHDGEFTVIPCALSADSIQVSPPETFLKMLEELPEGPVQPE